MTDLLQCQLVVAAAAAAAAAVGVARRCGIAEAQNAKDADFFYVQYFYVLFDECNNF